MELGLKGKKAVVCGSTQGIGKASAIELAKLGANVILIARNESSLKAALGELPVSEGQHHEYVVADFSKPEELQKSIEQIKEVNILVNNTGGPPAGTAEKAQVSEFTDAFRNHLICNHILVQSFLPAMKSSGYGRIINVISTSVKQPLKGLGVSNTIRAAVANWAKTLSAELAAHGITVNNVLPGATATQRLSAIIHNKANKSGAATEEVSAEMISEIPAGRFGKPEEIAAAVAFLASPAAAYINGINLPVDGGRTACL